MVVALKGDCFTGDSLEANVLDRPRVLVPGDAASVVAGDAHAEILSALLGEDGGVSRSWAILCSRF